MASSSSLALSRNAPLYSSLASPLTPRGAAADGGSSSAASAPKTPGSSAEPRWPRRARRRGSGRCGLWNARRRRGCTRREPRRAARRGRRS